MKNWKSTAAFFLFVFLYAYTICDKRTADIVDITAYTALIMAIVMSIRSDFGKEQISKLIDKLSIKR